MEMENEISIKQLLALCVRKGKSLLIAAVLFALLFGVYQYKAQVNTMTEEAARTLGMDSVEELKSQDNWKETVRKALELSYKEDLANYETESITFGQRIRDYEDKIVDQRKYIDKSLLMQLDPYKEYVTTICFFISNIDSSAYEQPFGQNITPYDYLVTRISGQYSSLWSRVQLQQALGLAEYKDTEDMYLRELVSLTAEEGGLLYISARGTTAEMSESLADAAYSYISSENDTISELSCVHSVMPVSRDTKVIIDQDLIAAQEAAITTLDDYREQICTLETEHQGLDEPSKPTTHILTSTLLRMILGGLVGAVVMCVWAVLKSFAQGKAESYAQLEQQFALPLFSALPKKRSIFDKWADSLMGENVWKDEGQALSYIEEKAKLLCAQRGTLLLTSSKVLDAEKVAAICKALSADGKAVEFADDFAHNPIAIDALRRCDGVIIAEELHQSYLSEIGAVLALAEKAKKPVDGFVLL